MALEIADAFISHLLKEQRFFINVIENLGFR
jgi:hypothetical protein